MRKLLSVTAALAANILLLGVFAAGPAWGVPANPKSVRVLQPDGIPVTISLRGDEFYSWHEDDNGYTVLKDGVTREWVYAERNADGTLKPGLYKAGSYDPARLGVERHLTDPVRTGQARQLRAARYSRSGGAPDRVAITSGTLKNLVILAAFSDQTTTYSQAQFASLFNDAGYAADGAVGSVKDYYLETSYNKITIVSTVSPWVTLPGTFASYGADAAGGDIAPKQMVIDAINALDADGFDFSTLDGNGDGLVDGLDIIHSGRGQESGINDTNYIWSHRWALDAPVVKDGVTMQAYHTEPEMRGEDADPLTWGITRIGVICHETGHFMGLPDLYDTGYDSYGAGDFCVMAYGSWNGNSGTSPAHMSAWCKKTLGWVTPTQLVFSGTYNLDRVEDHSDAVYLMRGPAFAATEYFLMENKQGFGFDAGLPGPTRGVLIWHVDETKADNNDQTHYLVDLEEADGVQNLANETNRGTDADYYRLGNNTVFNDTTTPNSLSYSGSPLDIKVESIGASADPMRFFLRGTEPASATPIAYPNPWKPGSGGTHDAAAITLSRLPDEANVRIYTIAGELVREFEVVRTDLGVKLWDGKNSAGKNAASGVYFANVKVSASDMKILKIAIER